MPIATWRLRYLYAIPICLALAGCNPADEITPRASAGMLIADTLPQREQIAQQLLAGGKVSNAGPFAAAPSIGGKLVMPFDFGLTTMGGAIVTYSGKYNVLVVQEPTLADGSVKWRCAIHPVEATPSMCSQR